ncbi:TonB-dependent receptor plug domain-containing protein [Denitrificimonas caeni]|uniref:TonB-dependent receptor plug domain-containing protein n=1 Tax=Denitrificimonas caeni TaxID=521720 RepID=UPI001963AEF1|nr:TonB-dependent receptor [Denitrificimonas caeni]
MSHIRFECAMNRPRADYRACATLLFLFSPLALAVEAVNSDQHAGHTMSPPVVTEALQLEPGVVKAEQEPLGATSVSQQTLRNLSSATSDTATLLRGVPGVSLNGTGGISSLPVIRGLADDRLRIKVDGMDLVSSCPNHMNPALSYVDPNNLDTLQVFSGITPVSVGGDSIGGTIIAESAKPEFAEPGAASINKGEIGAFMRSNNDARGGNFSATHANDVFNIRYAGSYSKANNYMAGGKFKSSRATGRYGETAALDEVASTAYETANHDLSMALKLGEDLLELKLGYQSVPQELFPNQRMDMTDNTQERINLRYLSQFDWGALETQLYHEKVEHKMNFGPDKRFWYGGASGAGSACSPLGPTCAAGMPMDSEGKTFGGNVKASIDLSERELLRIGGEYQRYRLNDYWPASGGGMWPNTFENIKDGERDRLGLFGEWEVQLNPSWLTLVGVRYEHVASDAGQVHGYGGAQGNQIPEAAAFNASNRSQSDNNWDLTALAHYSHDTNLDIEFGVARKVRSPNLYERYSWSTWAMAATMNNFVGDGNGYVGDVNLKPEAAHIASVTFDWHSADREHELKVTPFYTRVNDYIDAVSLPGKTITPNQFNVLQYANQSARIYGVDIAGRMPLLSNELGQWGLSGVVNYSNGKNRDSGDELYNSMPLNATLTLTQQLSGWNNSLEMLSVQSKNHGSDVRNEIQTAGYTLFNLRFSHSWDKVRLDFGVENLADKFYYLPTGGAYTAQGRTMSMNGIEWGVAVPGMGRSFYTGVNVAF